MTALAKDRTTPRRDGDYYSHLVAAATKIFAGSIVMLNAAGEAVPASAASGLTVAGVAEEQVDNSGGAAGDLSVKVRRGLFRFANGDAIVDDNIGDLAYADDDQTVFKAAAGRSPCGIIVAVDADGVWVEVRPRLTPGAADADLTDNTGTAPDGTVADVSTVVTGVDGTGNDAASKADVDTRLVAIDKNFAEATTEINAIKAVLRTAGLISA